MHDANLIVVHICNSQSEADMAKSALEAAGIDAMIQADSVGGMRPHIAWSSGGFKMLVREEDATAAHEVLESSEK
jgi:Putative prokaryotic signal transducing protein